MELCRAWVELRLLACGLLGKQRLHRSIAGDGNIMGNYYQARRKSVGSISLVAWICWAVSQNRPAFAWIHWELKFEISFWLVSLGKSFWESWHLIDSCSDRFLINQIVYSCLMRRICKVRLSYPHLKMLGSVGCHTSFAWFHGELLSPWIATSNYRQCFRNRYSLLSAASQKHPEWSRKQVRSEAKGLVGMLLQLFDPHRVYWEWTDKRFWRKSLSDQPGLPRTWTHFCS